MFTGEHFFFELLWVSADWPEGEGSNTTLEGLIQTSMGMRCTAGMGSAWVDSLWSQLESTQAQCGCSFPEGLDFFCGTALVWKRCEQWAQIHLVWRCFSDYKGKQSENVKMSSCLFGPEDAFETHSKKLKLGRMGAGTVRVKAGWAWLHGCTEGGSAEPPADVGWLWV